MQTRWVMAIKVTKRNTLAAIELMIHLGPNLDTTSSSANRIISSRELMLSQNALTAPHNVVALVFICKMCTKALLCRKVIMLQGYG